MSLNFLNIKDNKRRLKSKHFEVRNSLLKFLSATVYINKNLRGNFSINLTKKATNTSFSKIKNRCILTGNGKSCYSFFKLSRIQLKAKALTGLLYGIKKSSW